VSRSSGPALGRPLVDTIHGSSVANLKELRPGTVRILFAFDPWRSSILLMAGRPWTPDVAPARRSTGPTVRRLRHRLPSGRRTKESESNSRGSTGPPTERSVSSQKSETWQAKYALRAGIEGTINHALDVTGIRRARYHGLPKVRLQYAFSPASLSTVWRSWTTPREVSVSPAAAPMANAVATNSTSVTRTPFGCAGCAMSCPSPWPGVLQF
jgi:hypothetical protein